MAIHLEMLKSMRPASDWHGVQSLEEAIAHPVPGQDTHLPR